VNAGSRREALLLHGFTGSPSDLVSLADALRARGFSVVAPTFPGHDESPRALARTGWPDWHRAARDALLALGPRVAIAGLSMGALVALLLAAEHPDRVGALALLSTPLWLPLHVRLGARLAPVVRYLPKRGVDVSDAAERRRVAGYRCYPLAAVGSLIDLAARAQETAPRVSTPALIVHARHDHVAPFACAGALERSLGGPVRRVTLERSFHVMTRDVERDEVARCVGEFFEEHLA
jgi:carboxylesterase